MLTRMNEPFVAVVINLIGLATVLKQTNVCVEVIPDMVSEEEETDESVIGQPS